MDTTPSQINGKRETVPIHAPETRMEPKMKATSQRLEIERSMSEF